MITAQELRDEESRLTKEVEKRNKEAAEKWIKQRPLYIKEESARLLILLETDIKESKEHKVRHYARGELDREIAIAAIKELKKHGFRVDVTCDREVWKEETHYESGNPTGHKYKELDFDYTISW